MDMLVPWRVHMGWDEDVSLGPVFSSQVALLYNRNVCCIFTCDKGKPTQWFNHV